MVRRMPIFLEKAIGDWIELINPEGYAGEVCNRKDRCYVPARGGLITALQRIMEIRNRHAHISAMSQVRYQQLHDLIFSPEEDVSESVLEKILRMKINILGIVEKLINRDNGI